MPNGVKRKTMSKQMLAAIEYMVAYPDYKNADLANLVGKSEQTIANWMMSPIFIEGYEKRLKESWSDAGKRAQIQMKKLMENGDYRATEFILKCNGMNPTNKVDVSSDITTINVTINDNKDGPGI